jgi:tRNA A-37 threonylcarbamoyl transferase component Bud32
MVIVIDFDGTLALGDTSDITKMHPNIKLVNLLNQMYDDGNYIKIVTARGCKSCSNIEQRENKYRNIIHSWLKNHNIKYNELSFNKEYGDVYIDDRCYNIKDTIYYNKLDSKFTTNRVRRLNDCVVKKTESSKNEIEWYNKAMQIGINVPVILSYDVDTITTSYIDGGMCNNIDLIIDVLRKFKSTKSTNCVNFNSYINRIKIHLENNKNIKGGSKLIKLLNTINPPNTFNHGDFSTHNQIESNNNLYLIDSIYSEDVYQSYVIDAAKHLFSILYYELNCDFYNLCYNEYVSKLDIDSRELDILIACESIRVENRKKQLIDISNNLIDIL